MNHAISATEFRGNLYHCLDQVLATHKPLQIKRHGQLLQIAPVLSEKALKPEQHFKKRDNVFVGDPDDLADLHWDLNWTELQNLAAS